MRSLPLLTVVFALAASVGGNKAPDGTEIACDLPADLHRRNSTSRGQGCCVWTSIHHAALWQNVPAYLEAPKWIQQHGVPGGAWSGSVEKYLPQMARERGYAEPPAFLNYEGNDPSILRLACQTGRMPSVTYCFSPTGRYGGGRIAHMVNLVHADNKWFAVLDNNYPGANQIEWMTPQEFKRTWTEMGGGWAVILLQPAPPPVPHN
ncbi:MAG: hypothetical protein KatS3mg082_2728 [Nitrospiraceae bacterium]|nr:MAG: hypothetical protein KatS3mg082_2728 [Nitrospiraceae bacterium]GIW81331.1 MAG: hypothetical protein KatS3mg105_3138 [Gemmatales bacterium]